MPFGELVLTFSKVGIDISKVHVPSCVSHQQNSKPTMKEPVMIASMFNLDHRLAELRSTEQEQRTARALRKADTSATRPAGPAGATPSRGWSGAGAGNLSRPAAG
jgi:hypothetical protein